MSGRRGPRQGGRPTVNQNVSSVKKPKQKTYSCSCRPLSPVSSPEQPLLCPHSAPCPGTAWTCRRVRVLRASGPFQPAASGVVRAGARVCFVPLRSSVFRSVDRPQFIYVFAAVNTCHVFVGTEVLVPLQQVPAVVRRGRVAALRERRGLLDGAPRGGTGSRSPRACESSAHTAPPPALVVSLFKMQVQPP